MKPSAVIPNDGVTQADGAEISWAALESGAVIVHNLRLKRPEFPISMFSEAVWSLRPMDPPRGGLQTLRWIPGGNSEQRFHFPARFVESFKRIVWLLINRPTPVSYLAGSNAREWPAVASIVQRFGAFRHYAHYLGEHEVARLCDVTTDILDGYATELLAEETRSSRSSMELRLGYIGAIAHLAADLPEADRMIEPAWFAKDLGRRARGRAADNNKAIVAPDTFAPLLWWSRQIVGCATDIVAAASWTKVATSRPEPPEGSPAGLDAVGELVAARGGVLPSGRDGRVAAQYLIATWGGGIHGKDFGRWCRLKRGSYSLDDELPQPIPIPVSCTIEGQTWLPLVDYRDIREGKLLRILQAAAAVMICSCTGMRGEECRKLPRGALRTVLRPDGAHSFRIDGRIYKAVRDENDQQDPGGKPWIWATIKPGADAIDALERLASATGSGQLIGHPDTRNQPKRATRREQHPTNATTVRWIEELIEFANELAIAHQLHPSRRIAPDPSGRVTLDRFRRSIAWHIVNRPEGLLAAGVQFGHMKSTTTDGYGSTMTSGIAATMDQERTNALYNTLQDHANAAKTGMKVSGPATKRLGNALNRFEANNFPGTYLDLTKKEERRLLSDPDMVVLENPGHTCLCLADPMKPETMACSRGNDGEPNRNDCKTYCGSRVYTDQTVAEDRKEAAELRARLVDANRIMAARIWKRIEHLEEHIANHETRSLPLLSIMSAEEARVAGVSVKNDWHDSVPLGTPDHADRGNQ
ncbi:hypothetical protein KL953_34505 [Mycolicibacterium goodii]|uniref:hypothetical protein n=1 Tax=Mycolicibacterium goodii TaxID=134601 RepID=UPI001BDDA144|nr:hypothetical protein [Mycolicibacterium goodii]MBU8813977.1 hypothetical protein [Mycolicibacterium goodii]